MRTKRPNRLRKLKRSSRGSALLLVLGATATGMVLSGAFVASRSNSSVLAENLAASSRARSDAESALGLSIAALASNTAWRTEHHNGVLLARTDGDDSLHVQLTDIATGAAPTHYTVDVLAEVVARRGGIKRVAEAVLFVARPEDNASIDVDLSEFAITGGESIEIRDDATVGTWEVSPAATRGDPIRLTTVSQRSSNVFVEQSGSIVDGVLFTPNASSFATNELPTRVLTDAVAMPDSAPAPTAESEAQDTDLRGLVASSVHVHEIDLGNGDVLELAEGVDLYIGGDVRIRHGGVLRLHAAHTVTIEGDLKVNGGSIEVPPTASLTINVGGTVDLRGANVGEASPTVDRWVPKVDRVRFHAITRADEDSAPLWRLRGETLFQGEIYAPAANVRIQNNATLIGRVAARNVHLDGAASLLYEPALDNRNGYTAADQRAFDAYGEVVEPIATLANLSHNDMREAAEALEVPLSGLDSYIGLATELANLLGDDGENAEEINNSRWRGRWNRGNNSRWNNRWRRYSHADRLSRSIHSVNVMRIGHAAQGSDS